MCKSTYISFSVKDIKDIALKCLQQLGELVLIKSFVAIFAKQGRIKQKCTFKHVECIIIVAVRLKFL